MLHTHLALTGVSQATFGIIVHVILCRVSADMQAAAATSVKPAQPTIQASAEHAAEEKKPEANNKQSSPRWDLSDGDTWYKRQQVFS